MSKKMNFNEYVRHQMWLLGFEENSEYDDFTTYEKIFDLNDDPKYGREVASDALVRIDITETEEQASNYPGYGIVAINIDSGFANYSLETFTSLFKELEDLMYYQKIPFVNNYKYLSTEIEEKKSMSKRVLESFGLKTEWR